MLRGKTLERWNVAQGEEKQYWNCGWKPGESKYRKKLVIEYWNWYLNSLEAYAELNAKSMILEIGCGADGIINYMGKGEKIAIDPLMDYYGSNFTMSKEVRWVKGVGENIPFEDEYFDIVLTTNALDHTRDPKKVLSEIRRVLRSRGILFLTVDCHQPFFLRYYSKMKEALGRGNKLHPYFFSSKDIKNVITKSGLQVLSIQKGIGDLGKYTSEKLANHSTKLSAEKRGLFRKSLVLFRERGFGTLLDAGIDKLLRLFVKKLTREEIKIDFIFIARK